MCSSTIRIPSSSLVPAYRIPVQEAAPDAPRVPPPVVLPRVAVEGLAAWLSAVPEDARAQLHLALRQVASLMDEHRAEGTQTEVNPDPDWPASLTAKGSPARLQLQQDSRTRMVTTLGDDSVSLGPRPSQKNQNPDSGATQPRNQG